MDYEKLDQALTGAGFEHRDDHVEYFQALGHELGMSENGAYEVHRTYVKGGVTVLIEQNTAPEANGDLQMLVTHPPVAVIEGPKGRVAANPKDVALVLEQAESLA